jgi:DNA-binding NtrC family response regulator
MNTRPMKKILIVDDELHLLEVIDTHFKIAGWQTELASDGQQALEKVKTFAPHVILSDINMPVMDGLRLLEELAKTGSEIPVIFFTGFSNMEKMKAAWGLSAFDFLDKPCNHQVMLQVAENAYDYGAEYVRAARKRFLKLRRN